MHPYGHRVANALTETLGRNQGPTKLCNCDIDNLHLSDGLRGNSHLKSWSPRLSGRETGNQKVLAIAVALKENKGLVDLSLLHNFPMIDEAWDAICDCLKTDPALELLCLRSLYVEILAQQCSSSPGCRYSWIC
jgi:hypothetical protein